MRLATAADGRGTLIEVKVVPGASRSRIAGEYGDGIRVQVAAAPERGKANEALTELLAEKLGVAHRDVTVVRGMTSPRKTVLVAGVAPAEVQRRLRS